MKKVEILEAEPHSPNLVDAISLDLDPHSWNG